MVVYTYNPITQEAEAGVRVVWDHPCEVPGDIKKSINSFVWLRLRA